MRDVLRRGAVVALAAALLGTSAACGSDSDAPKPLAEQTPPPEPTEQATPSAGSGPVYVLSGELCTKADQSPLADLYPKEGANPLVNTERLCITHRTSGEKGIDLTVDAEVLRDEATARLFVETGRRLAKRPYTDVTGAGTDAHWSGDQDDVKLTSYNGNLVLEVEASVNVADGLPPDIVQRLVKVAAGTYQRLAP
ncbi:hypothetical protein [Micromonospora sp. CPCC 206061]|uniref:hypothetical protein n=1 Tax=Micromonospora sp. CPCC 206061 TaxID=3122410 RepID=UPI002FEEAC25